MQQNLAVPKKGLNMSSFKNLNKSKNITISQKPNDKTYSSKSVTLTLSYSNVFLGLLIFNSAEKTMRKPPISLQNDANSGSNFPLNMQKLSLKFVHFYICQLVLFILLSSPKIGFVSRAHGGGMRKVSVKR